jgi:hypothetical protein
MNMFKKLFAIIPIGIGIFTFINSGAFASEKLFINYGRNTEIISRLKMTTPGHFEIYGEILMISPAEVVIINKEKRFHLKMAPRVQVFCNGYSSVSNALLPVTPEALFEAEVMIDDRNEVILVNGFYYGEACIIKSWEKDNTQFKLRLFSPGSRQTASYLVKSGARIPDGNGWLEEGREIFVLFSMQGGVRAIYLPI